MDSSTDQEPTSLLTKLSTMVHLRMTKLMVSVSSGTCRGTYISVSGLLVRQTDKELILTEMEQVTQVDG